mmetsp:Transcript_117934/g.328582  ORF Transcript_117934/g.328582 Transcript_117934/m.328582 type:complete len:213 (+) Transcript_117934:165-803(+)
MSTYWATALYGAPGMICKPTAGAMRAAAARTGTTPALPCPGLRGPMGPRGLGQARQLVKRVRRRLSGACIPAATMRTHPTVKNGGLPSWHPSRRWTGGTHQGSCFRMTRSGVVGPPTSLNTLCAFALEPGVASRWLASPALVTWSVQLSRSRCARLRRPWHRCCGDSETARHLIGESPNPRDGLARELQGSVKTAHHLLRQVCSNSLTVWCL